jgi:uncharacterized protein
VSFGQSTWRKAHSAKQKNKQPKLQPMITLNEIQQFLEPKKMAMAGVSRNPKKFGGAIFTELKNKGFDLYPINPNVEEIHGVKCYKSVSELPGDVKHLFIVTPKKETAGIVAEAAAKGIERIWIQQSSDTPEAIEIAKAENIPVIYQKCMMMFADPVKSIHGFHRSIVKFFGGYPKLVPVN